AAGLLAVGDVLHRGDEGAELLDGHLVLAQVERLGERHLVLRRLVVTAQVVAPFLLRRSHEESARWNEGARDSLAVGEFDREPERGGVLLLVAAGGGLGEWEPRRRGWLFGSRRETKQQAQTRLGPGPALGSSKEPQDVGPQGFQTLVAWCWFLGGQGGG